MIRARYRIWILALFSAALLVPRLGGTHLHLCLDGSAPPISLHVAAGGSSDDEHLGVAGSHEDQTVDVSSPVIGKVSPPGLDGLLMLALVLVFVLFRQVLLLPVARALVLPLPPAYVRPPHRGPPA